MPARAGDGLADDQARRPCLRGAGRRHRRVLHGEVAALHRAPQRRRDCGATARRRRAGRSSSIDDAEQAGAACRRRSRSAVIVAARRRSTSATSPASTPARRSCAVGQPDVGLADRGVALGLRTPPVTLSTRKKPMISTTTPVTTTVVAPTRSCSERRHVPAPSVRRDDPRAATGAAPASRAAEADQRDRASYRGRRRHGGPALYPTPRTVSTTSGRSGSRSTLARSRWTWTLTSRVSAACR